MSVTRFVGSAVLGFAAAGLVVLTPVAAGAHQVGETFDVVAAENCRMTPWGEYCGCE